MSDIIGIVDDSGNLVVSYAYDVWGKVTSVTGSNTAIGELNPFRYRSYYYDSDIQLYYLQSRYYDAEIGRFINSDDVSFIGLTISEISYNPFTYCENKPVNSYDPGGNATNSLSKLLKLISKNINKIVHAAELSEEAINLSRNSSWIRTMKNISHNVSYTKKYDLYEIDTYASTKKWYYQESFTIITYSTSVGNWYKIYDDVNSKMTKFGIADLVYSSIDIFAGIAIGKFFAKSTLAAVSAKLSLAAGIIGIPVGILALMASDAFGTLERNLRYKNKNDIYTFNWLVAYSNQVIGQSKSTAVLEWYCTLAYVMGTVL